MVLKQDNKIIATGYKFQINVILNGIKTFGVCLKNKKGFQINVILNGIKTNLLASADTVTFQINVILNGIKTSTFPIH